MSDDLVARLNVVLATLEHGGLLMIAQDDCRWIPDAKAEIERLRAALTECSAPYDSGPTTVLDGARLVAAEFQRRMDIAGSALSPLPAQKG